MKHRVNIQEKSQILNEFISKNSNKTFTSGELMDALKELGFNKNVAGIIARSAFTYEKAGTSTLYETPKKPIYIGLIESAYKKANNYQKVCRKSKNLQEEETLSEEKALALLSTKGYQIRKCIGFDLDRFAKENPDLYKKYLKYEII